MPKPKYIPSKPNFYCPNCGQLCSDESRVKKAKPEIRNYPEIHYSWREWHKCLGCETHYTIQNGT